MARAIINEDVCKGCALCTTACPQKIVVIAEDHINHMGYKPAVILDANKCTGCSFCAIMCPDCAIIVEK